MQPAYSLGPSRGLIGILFLSCASMLPGASSANLISHTLPFNAIDRPTCTDTGTPGDGIQFCPGPTSGWIVATIHFPQFASPGILTGVTVDLDSDYRFNVAASATDVVGDDPNEIDVDVSGRVRGRYRLTIFDESALHPTAFGPQAFSPWIPVGCTEPTSATCMGNTGHMNAFDFMGWDPTTSAALTLADFQAPAPATNGDVSVRMLTQYHAELQTCDSDTTNVLDTCSMSLIPAFMGTAPQWSGSITINYTYVPEPATLALTVIGLTVFGLGRRKRG